MQYFFQTLQHPKNKSGTSLSLTCDPGFGLILAVETLQRAQKCRLLAAQQRQHVGVTASKSRAATEQTKKVVCDGDLTPTVPSTSSSKFRNLHLCQLFYQMISLFSHFQGFVIIIIAIKAFLRLTLWCRSNCTKQADTHTAAGIL